MECVGLRVEFDILCCLVRMLNWKNDTEEKWLLEEKKKCVVSHADNLDKECSGQKDNHQGLRTGTYLACIGKSKEATVVGVT